MTNNAEDQAKVIQLFAAPAIGRREDGAWGNNKFILNNGSCPKPLADAIWDFQLHWKNRGVFKNIDGVVDRDGNTIKKMNGLILVLLR